jgi:hypothetical protein
MQLLHSFFILPNQLVSIITDISRHPLLDLTHLTPVI